jgi:hypothetical protein
MADSSSELVISAPLMIIQISFLHIQILLPYFWYLEIHLEKQIVALLIREFSIFYGT